MDYTPINFGSAQTDEKPLFEEIDPTSYPDIFKGTNAGIVSIAPNGNFKGLSEGIVIEQSLLDTVEMAHDDHEAFAEYVRSLGFTGEEYALGFVKTRGAEAHYHGEDMVAPATADSISFVLVRVDPYSPQGFRDAITQSEINWKPYIIIQHDGLSDFFLFSELVHNGYRVTPRFIANNEKLPYINLATVQLPVEVSQITGVPADEAYKKNEEVCKRHGFDLR